MSNEGITCFTTGWSALMDAELWVKWLDILTNIATIVAAVGAVIAVRFAYKQLRSNQEETRSATAHNIYHQYLTLCLEKPEFANGMAKPADRDPVYGKYCWFVSIMLFTFEQILETKFSDEQWQQTIKSQLKMHKEFLASSSTVKNKEWDGGLQQLIEQVLIQD